MSKYGEPWIVSNYTDEDDKVGILTNDNGIVVCVWKRHNRQALKRIVACVNAMAGIDDPEQFVKDCRTIVENANRASVR